MLSLSLPDRLTTNLSHGETSAFRVLRFHARGPTSTKPQPMIVPSTDGTMAAQGM
jgi:hypothetical protein